MPNRYVREDAIESEAVNAISWTAEVFWRRLINRVDDFGRYTANPALLRASLFPLRLAKVTEAEVDKLLGECESVGLLFTYTIGSKRFLVMNKWEQGRAKESKHPSPPDDVCKRMQTYVYTRKRLQTDVPDSDSDPDTDANSGSRFQPPTRDELNLEAAKVGLPDTEVDKFVSYYSANGWKVGRNPMKSWPHALAGWAARWRERGGVVVSQSETPEQREKRILKECL